jgi:cell wall-associated NlpC family hydrolase
MHERSRSERHLKVTCRHVVIVRSVRFMASFRIAVALTLASTVVPCSVPGQQANTAVAHIASQRRHVSSVRLLQPDDGLNIIAAALKLRPRLDSGYDCSHLVHAVYEQAGFPYEYATAAQLYAGVSEFRRVLHPQPGDLVVFADDGKHGHVGIMVNPARRLFFSGLSHGPGISSYASRYWRARGYPRFLRYVRRTPPPKTRTASLR